MEKSPNETIQFVDDFLDETPDEQSERIERLVKEGEEDFAELYRLTCENIAKNNGRKNGLFIGKRIEKLLIDQDFTVTQLALRAGINRTTLYRCINEDGAISQSTVRKIIKALDIDVWEFSANPDSYDDWVKYARKTADLSGWRQANIYKFRDDVLSELKTSDFYYIVDTVEDGKKVKRERRVKRKYVSVLIKAIETAFKIIDLIPHNEYSEGDRLWRRQQKK